MIFELGSQPQIRRSRTNPMETSTSSSPNSAADVAVVAYGETATVMVEC